MTEVIQRLRKEEGNVLVVAFIFLVVLTLIGIFSTRTARMDMQIASNEIPYKRNFYIAEAGLYREAAELGRGRYPVTKVAESEALVLSGAPQNASITIPDPQPHLAMGQAYDFSVWYLGAFPPPKGYSTQTYARYDYEVGIVANSVTVDSRLYKIGPKVE